MSERGKETEGTGIFFAREGGMTLGTMKESLSAFRGEGIEPAHEKKRQNTKNIEKQHKEGEKKYGEKKPIAFQKGPTLPNIMTGKGGPHGEARSGKNG